jgi:hypothetical protein
MSSEANNDVVRAFAAALGDAVVDETAARRLRTIGEHMDTAETATMPAAAKAAVAPPANDERSG